MPEKDPKQPLALPEDYVATFEGFRPGQNVLQDLSARFYDRRTYTPGGIEGQRETDRRAAHKEVIEFILRMMAQQGGDNNVD